MSKHTGLTITAALGWIVPFVGTAASIGASAALLAAKKPTPAVPEPVEKQLFRRDQRARSVASEALGTGRQGTLLTGQQGVTGQAVTQSPTLLGR